jgi:hypothetical protein
MSEAMLTRKFDAYGGALPEAGANRAPAGTGSAFLNRAGLYAFWLLVFVIVTARIVYYPAAPNFEVGSASDPKQVIAR